MDAVTDPDIHTVVVRSSSQVGKTEILLNVVGYFASQDPSPILFIQPTLEMAEAVSKDRIAPLFRDTPKLRDLLLRENREDTIRHKQFVGGHLTLAGANSPASLASRPVRIVLLDEVDRYPPSAGAEGDPITLARARSKTFWNRRTVLTSTPTVKGASRIDQAFAESDQRFFFIPCPECGHRQTLVWKNVRWEADRPATARYVCEGCGVFWSDSERHECIASGSWQPTAQSRGIAGFALNELYSPWSRLEDIVANFLDVKHSRDGERMRAWTNTTLGESYEVGGETVDDGTLAGRAEEYHNPPVLVKTAGVDIQDDRAEIELIGWGEGEESWSLRYDVIHGDPSAPAFWADIDRWWQENRPDAMAVDSGGHYTQRVYEYCHARLRNRVYAVKGAAGARPVWPKRATKVKHGFVYVIGVDAAKDVVYGRFRIRTPGPGYAHFPTGRDETYYRGLVGEVCVTKWSKGFPIREWNRRPGVERNEPLDCRVYGYAALISLQIRDWARVKNRLRATDDTAQPQGESSSPLPTPPVVAVPLRRPTIRRGAGFVMGWK